jgi:hypothetical protein
VDHEVRGDEVRGRLRRAPARDLLERRGERLLEPLGAHELDDAAQARGFLGARPGLDVACGLDRVRGHPLHAVARIGEQDLHRRLAGNRLRLLVLRDQDAALVVEELDLAREHGEQRSAALEHLDLPIGAADRGGGRRSLEVEVGGRGVGLRPAASLFQAQDRALRGRGRRGLDLHHRLLGEAHLGLVAEEQPHPAVGAGAHEFQREELLARHRGLPGRRLARPALALALHAHHFGSALGALHSQTRARKQPTAKTQTDRHRRSPFRAILCDPGKTGADAPGVSAGAPGPWTIAA